MYEKSPWLGNMYTGGSNNFQALNPPGQNMIGNTSPVQSGTVNLPIPIPGHGLLNLPLNLPNGGSTGGSTGTPSTVPSRPDQSSYQAPRAPTFDSRLRDMYVDTFNNPQTFWDEYSQGQGAAITEGAARGLAKSGRTGLLPTLQTQAYQDYMGNYLPSVRKDLAPGLNYEQGMNSLQTQLYGSQLDFTKGMYGSDVTRYGHELQAQQNARSEDVRLQLGLLENQLKMLDIDERSTIELYRILGTTFKDMDEATQRSFIADLQAALGTTETENNNMRDVTSPARPTIQSDAYGNY